MLAVGGRDLVRPLVFPGSKMIPTVSMGQGPLRTLSMMVPSVKELRSSKVYLGTWFHFVSEKRHSLTLSGNANHISRSLG